MGYTITTPCKRCKRWLHPRLIEGCADCALMLCGDCAAATGHRMVHEPPQPEYADVLPDGWHYLRCRDTPYSIHDDEADALAPAPTLAQAAVWDAWVDEGKVQP